MFDHGVGSGQEHDFGARLLRQGADDCVDAVAGIFDEDDVGGGRIDVGGEVIAGAGEQLLITATEPCLGVLCGCLGGGGGGGILRGPG